MLYEFISSIYLQFALFSSTLFRTSVLQSKKSRHTPDVLCQIKLPFIITFFEVEYLLLFKIFVYFSSFGFMDNFLPWLLIFGHHFEVVNIMICSSTYKKIAKFQTVKFPPVWMRSVVHVWNLLRLSHFVSGFLLFALPGPTPRRPVHSNQIPD